MAPKGLFLKHLSKGKSLFHLGITGKLLWIVLPLVVLPCLVTGGLGYFASEEIVTRLLNQSQINLAREIAEEIDQVFNICRADLEMISHLPVLRDYYLNRFYALDSEAGINQKEAERFFKDVARKSTLYYRISYMDAKGCAGGMCSGRADCFTEGYPQRLDLNLAKTTLCPKPYGGFPGPEFRAGRAVGITDGTTLV